jgi:hypothetical protein
MDLTAGLYKRQSLSKAGGNLGCVFSVSSSPMSHMLARCFVPACKPSLLPDLQVLLSAMLWGCGTAIGEVPPYFLSFKAASAGRRNVMYESVQSSFSPAPSGWWQNELPVPIGSSLHNCMTYLDWFACLFNWCWLAIWQLLQLMAIFHPAQHPVGKILIYEALL